jgi:deazaflavin-dependent oxidoreductase (nitroreductase family)
MASEEEILGPTTDWVARHHDRYVATDGADGHTWRGVPTLLLTTRGRRSGALRRTPLIYGRANGAYVVVGSRGGHDRHPAWFLNLRDEPAVTIQVGAEVGPARARVAAGEERERLWGEMAAIWPDYDRYQGRTEREIPVVVLEPAA